MRGIFNVTFRIVSSLLGLLMMLAGTFWALQGLHMTGPNDRSFMVGDKHWVAYGAILAVVGLGQAIWSNTRQH
jgi:hypothetical protein